MHHITVPLSERELEVASELARQFEISRESLLRQALRVYQHVALEQAKGHRLAFVDAKGDLVPEPHLPMLRPDFS